MQLTVIALIFGAAIVAWLMLMSKSGSNDNAVAERFSGKTAPDESAKKNTVTLYTRLEGRGAQ